MSSLVIPPSPNWYETSILACSPDNTLIYGARSDIVILEDSEASEPATVKIIPKAHSQKVISVSLNKNWNNPHRYAASVGLDKIVKVWDISSLKRKIAHNAHINHTNVVAVQFSGDERVVSVSEEGHVIVFSINSNQATQLKDLFCFKVSVTCMSICPHASWLSAFGLRNGLVIVADLRKNGRTLYKLRGHDKSVLSLSWCPAPVNIFPKSPCNFVGTKNVPSIVENEVTEQNNQADSDTNRQAHEISSLGSIEHTSLRVIPESKESIEVLSTTKSDLKSEDDSLPPVPDSKLINVDQKIEDGVGKKELPEDASSIDKTVLELNIDSTSKEPSTFLLPSNNDKNEVKEISHETDVDKSKEIAEIPNPSSDHLNNEISESGSSHSEVPDADVKLIDNDSEANKENELHKECDVSECDAVLNKSCSDKPPDELNVEEEQQTRCIPIESVEEEPRKEFLLASSAKENKIYIWRAGTDGRLQTFLTFPSKGNNRKNFKVDKLWITLHWATPTKLLSSSKNAELVQWTLPKSKGKSNPSLIHNDHHTQLFAITGPVKILDEYNWLTEQGTNAWTIGQERLLLNTSLESDRSVLSSYPTFGGSVVCAQCSPLDPCRLAFGTTDGFIKFLDLSKLHIKKISITNFYQKIQSKVMTLAWHPVIETRLAYGTFEGRVGYLDVNNSSKAPSLFPHFFKSQVHKIEYGPFNGDDEKQFGLYALSEGTLIYFNSGDIKKDPVIIEKPDDAFIYTFSWKPDFSSLIVTTKKNTLIFYSKEFNIIRTVYIQEKIQDIHWHPDACSDSKTNKYYNCFASVCNSKNVVVFDISEDKGINEMMKFKYEGKIELINFVSWSPYNEDQIAIATEQGLGIIWDFEQNATIASYVSPNYDSLLTLLWNPLDPDVMISGSRDQTLRIWRISDYPPKDEKEFLTERKLFINEVQTYATEFLPKDLTNEENVKPKKTSSKTLLSKFYSAPKDPTQLVDDMKKLFSWRENPCDTFTGNGNKAPDILDVFGPTQNILNLLDTNGKDWLAKGQYNKQIQLALFRGDISSAIKDAINEKRVNPFVISLAPMVSPKIWQEACETYADQLPLESDSDPIEIATYYLACHKVESAVDILCERSLFREALALAKCRFIEDAQPVETLMEKWAKHALLTGNFELSAQCYIFLGKYENAASVLFRRSDAEVLKFASELAQKTENEELYKAIMVRYNAFAAHSEQKEPETKETQESAQQILNGAEHGQEVLQELCDNGCVVSENTETKDP